MYICVCVLIVIVQYDQTTTTIVKLKETYGNIYYYQRPHPQTPHP